MTDQAPRNILRNLPCAVLIAAAALAPAFARGYTTPGFRSRQARPMRLVVLPPHADFIKSKVVMTDQMTAESAALETEGAKVLQAQIEAKGHAVRILTPEDLARSAMLRQLVTKVNDRYGEEWGRIVYRPRAVKQKRYSAGEDVVRLCSMLKVDGVVVARVVAVGQTKGKATFSYFMGGGSSSTHSYARIDVGILNARQGQVEAFFTGYEASSLGQLTKKAALVMSQATENALGRYPDSATFEAVKDEEVETAADRTDGQGDAEDEAAIQDFEVLIKKSGAAPPSGR